MLIESFNKNFLTRPSSKSGSSSVEAEDDMPIPDSDEFRPLEAKWREIHPSDQRPPVYNPEDFVFYLKKYGRPAWPTESRKDVSGKKSKNKSDKGEKDWKDYRHPNLTPCGEMTLRQLDNISELLRKLKTDLKMSFPSFVREFVCDPCDGVTLLLDVLKTLQITQSDASLAGSIHDKERHTAFMRALADEYECLMCLRLCMRCDEGIHKLVDYSGGLYTLAICIMSSIVKSRIIAIELLALTCETSQKGHSQVLEALSTLRLRFAEPVRFRFLIGQLHSYSSPTFQLVCMRLLNSLIEGAASPRQKVFLQGEIQEAGLELNVLKKNLQPQHPHTNLVRKELDRWEDNYIDVNFVVDQLDHLQGELHQAKDKQKELEKESAKLEEAERALRDKVKTLETQLSKINANHDQQTQTNGTLRQNSGGDMGKREGTQSPPVRIEVVNGLTPTGLSSPQTESSDSDRSMISIVSKPQTQNKKYNQDTDEDTYGILERERIDETVTVERQTIPMESRPGSHHSNETEGTTIEEVMEELNNIINNASSGLCITDTENWVKETTRWISSDLKRQVKPPHLVPTEENSDTESAISTRHNTSTGQTIESESTKSFGFVRPKVNYLAGESALNDTRRHHSVFDLTSSVRRAESFQYEARHGYSHVLKRRGSFDQLEVDRVPLTGYYQNPLMCLMKGKSRQNKYVEEWDARDWDAYWEKSGDHKIGPKATKKGLSPDKENRKRHKYSVSQQDFLNMKNRKKSSSKTKSKDNSGYNNLHYDNIISKKLYRGFIERGHGNDGKYSSKYIELDIPTPDYSVTTSPNSTLSTVINFKPTARMLDHPAGLY